ncbi:TonB-dependent receptor domain-containing protein [Novosphingobium decolorationis]|uniref:TonB-dependent receptor n=1 Tax=Novosphingobium decolorationis TaxID=2698673 RepID=A0ABX8EBB5_9SPHN|nr:TonB-dependent receptor [Novosphingobium decolorationis]QVM85475.1 TonB-dependent receptor [Novosphingobium decolorationis]
MTKSRLVPLLLLSTVMTPGIAQAQDSTTTPETLAAPAETAQDEPEGDAPDVSIPGGAIIVTGRRIVNVERSATEVLSVLSSEDIARTGEGDIAGALGHVTGLSVVGNGYVYVRGLGDRYSLALLNGSPLPSPEPLKRVVPLDLFPTSVVASSMVQKSYSVNFPGEFGGGVINLTTQAVPEESFLKIGGGIGWDSETTNKLSYSYYGSKTDWTGYDNGLRRVPHDMQALFDSNLALNPNSELADDIGSILFTPRNSVIQTIENTQPNFSADLSAGTSFDLGGATLGVIATAGYSNTTQTRQALRQSTQLLSGAYEDRDQDGTTVQSDNRVIVNGLLGLGLEWGENSIRWTNVYIHDTDKYAALASFKQPQQNANWDFMEQSTGWYERQLIDSQFTGEFKPADDTTIDLRAGYANSKRLAPYEIVSRYIRRNTGDGGVGDLFTNALGSGTGSAPTSISFSRLNEDVWSAGADVSHRFSTNWSGTVGYAYQINSRESRQRQFLVIANGDSELIEALGTARLDVLLQTGQWYLDRTGLDYDLQLQDPTAPYANYRARLLNHAFYGKVDGTLADGLTLDAGVRWEWAKEQSLLVPVEGVAESGVTLKNEYFLPAATLTYEIDPEMQIRINGSKTIARPQFRELIFQNFFDPETNRTYQGNPQLIDSQLYNAEARWEWYFNRDEHVSLGGFYKHIKNPIESYLLYSNGYFTRYANAPSADLYGAEVELQKYFDLYNLGSFFETRRIALNANYTYTKSQLNVTADDITNVNGFLSAATNYFVDGAPLTGQSKHIANLQFGLEDTDSLSQQTIMLNYASKRVTSRGVNGTIRQPDIFEHPGFTIDVIVRQGIMIGASELELKFEGRNLTGRAHKEYQSFEDGDVQFNTYALGRVFKASASIKF